MSNALFTALLGFSALITSLLLWFRAIREVAIPDNRLGFLLLWLAASVFGVYSFFLPGASWLSGIPGALSAFGGSLFLILYTLSKQGEDNPIDVGDSIPEFSGTDDGRSEFESALLTGNPVLIKFFRGHW